MLGSRTLPIRTRMLGISSAAGLSHRVKQNYKALSRMQRILTSCRAIVPQTRGVAESLVQLITGPGSLFLCRGERSVQNQLRITSSPWKADFDRNSRVCGHHVLNQHMGTRQQVRWARREAIRSPRSDVLPLTVFQWIDSGYMEPKEPKEPLCNTASESIERFGCISELQQSFLRFPHH